MATTVLVRPAGTSWTSVLGGWIATIGAMALIAPAIAAILGRASFSAGDITPAVPVIIGIFVSYLIGGYVAGRMAGYRTSWHGMMTAFLSLFVLLLVALLGYAADRGLLAGSGVQSLADIVPGFRELSPDSVGTAVTFGAIVGFLVAIFAGWLGGVLAPSHAAFPVATAPRAAPRAPMAVPRERASREEVVRDHRPLVPSFGRKGGERVVEERREEQVDRG